MFYNRKINFSQTFPCENSCLNKKFNVKNKTSNINIIRIIVIQLKQNRY